MSRPHPSDLVEELIALAVAALGDAPGSAGPELGERLARIRRRELPIIDACMRSSATGWSSGWAQLHPRRIARAETPWSVAVLATMHGSGFVRELAVRRLGDAGDARALPFVVMRLNDWVAEVRRAARAALAQYVRPEFASALVAVLPAIVALRRQHRDDHRAVIGWVLTMLAAPDVVEIRRAGCRDPDLETRRACLHFCVEIAPDDADVLGVALADPEPGIRTWAIRRARSNLPPSLASEICRHATGDRSAQVRRIALRELAELVPPEDLVALAEAALLDEAAAARWQGRLLRTRVGRFDFGRFYRDALVAADTPTRIRAALLGLGESGDANDLPRVEPHLASASVRTRRVAVKVLGQLAPAELVEPFFAWLCDPLPGVSAAARRVLVDRIERVGAERLLRILAGCEAAHVRRNVVALGRRLSKWDALTILITALDDVASSPVIPIARAGLTAWMDTYNRSFTAPTSSQLAMVEEALARARLQDGARTAVRELLQGARRMWGH